MLESSAHSIARGSKYPEAPSLLGSSGIRNTNVYIMSNGTLESCFWTKTTKAQMDVRTHLTFGPALGVGLRWKRQCPQLSLGAYLPQALLVQARIQHPFAVSCMSTFCQLLGMQWRAQVKRFWFFGEQAHVLQTQAQCKSHRGNDLEHWWSVMQTILASVSLTIALINHPDMQCSGERILVQFQGVIHHARESRQPL